MIPILAGVVAGIFLGAFATVVLLSFCTANRGGEDVFVSACSHCGQRLLNAEKTRGLCCHCASIPPRHRAGGEVEVIGQHSP